MALWGERSTPLKTWVIGKMAKLCPHEMLLESIGCAWNRAIHASHCAHSPRKRRCRCGCAQSLANRLDSRGLSGISRRHRIGCAELSTQPVDKRVDERVRGAFHAPVFVGFRKDGEIMTISDSNKIIRLAVKPVCAHELLCRSPCASSQKWACAQSSWNLLTDPSTDVRPDPIRTGAFQGAKEAGRQPSREQIGGARKSVAEGGTTSSHETRLALHSCPTSHDCGLSHGSEKESRFIHTSCG